MELSTQIARRIAGQVAQDAGTTFDRFAVEEMANALAPLITAEYEPVMELLREAVAHPKFESDGAGGIRYYITKQEIAKARRLLGENP